MKEPEQFLDGRVTLWCGDCLKVMAEMPENSVDSCVTDAPYHLQSIHKRFAAKGRDETSERYAAGPYGRTAKGFMGKQWDGGDIAFRPETWAAVLRVLKPGAHLVAFGGTRTYHRMVCAIEDAGFEIRDQVGWFYGSGFPKSFDVSKAIDKAAGADREMVATGDPVKRMIPGADQHKDGWEKNNGREYVPNESTPVTEAGQQWDGWGTALKPAQEPIVLARKPLSESTVAANVLKWGTGALNIGACRVQTDASHDNRDDNTFCTCPSPTGGQTDRNPNIGNQALFELLREDQNGPHPNVEVYGIERQLREDSRRDYSSSSRSDDAPVPEEGARDQAASRQLRDAHRSLDRCATCGGIRDYLSKPHRNTTPDINGREGEPSAGRRYTDEGATNFAATPGPRGGSKLGRWPANVIHDGSEEVVAVFPESAGQLYDRPKLPKNSNGIYGDFGEQPAFASRGDSGSAGRFFYTAKADSDDRIGSKHPTVKPVDLIRYLVRLITPPGGRVLDPFSGTGTTGEAAWREGMSGLLIEREAEYQDDIRRRMKLCLAGPDERARESIKAKTKNKPIDAGPLFGGS